MRALNILVVVSGTLLPGFAYGPAILADWFNRSGWEAASDVSTVSANCESLSVIAARCSASYRVLDDPSRKVETLYYAMFGPSWDGEGVGYLRPRGGGRLTTTVAVAHVGQRAASLAGWLLLGLLLTLRQTPFWARLTRGKTGTKAGDGAEDEEAENRSAGIAKALATRRLLSVTEGVALTAKSNDPVPVVIVTRKPREGDAATAPESLAEAPAERVARPAAARAAGFGRRR